MVWTTSFDKEEEFKFAGGCVQPFQREAANANCMLDHMCALHVASRPPVTRLSGLVCTIGKASREVHVLEALIESGMNIACISFLHGKLRYHAEVLQNMKIALNNFNKKVGMKYPLAIAAMTMGPVIIASFPVRSRHSESSLLEGDTVELCPNEDYVNKKNNPKIMHINYANLSHLIKVGRKINIDQRRIVLACTDIVDDIIVCKVVKGGFLRSGCRLYLPGTPVDIPGLSDTDKRVLRFVLDNNMDIIIAAYIRGASAVNQIREFLGAEGSHIMICSEIENQQGIMNMDEIINASDGIVVARRDLSYEIDETELFLAQKALISKCNALGKPVVCTTHLLESMLKSKRPTRAEATDVANAILDGSDCIMLYHETSVGDYPVTSARQAAAICRQADSAVWQKRLVMDLSNKINPPVITIHALAAAAVEISFSLFASAIVLISSSMKTAHWLSQYRPKCPIVAVTRDARHARQAHLFRGIIPLLYKDERHQSWEKDVENRVYYGINFGRKRGFIKPGDPVVLMTSMKQGSGFADKMRVFYVTKETSHGTECTC